MLKDLQTSASLKKEQFRFILERRAATKNVRNFLVDANSLFVIAKNVTICTMAEYKQDKCIILAVVPVTFVLEYLLDVLNPISNTDMYV